MDTVSWISSAWHSQPDCVPNDHCWFVVIKMSLFPCAWSLDFSALLQFWCSHYHALFILQNWISFFKIFVTSFFIRIKMHKCNSLSVCVCVFPSLLSFYQNSWSLKFYEKSRKSKSEAEKIDLVQCQTTSRIAHIVSYLSLTLFLCTISYRR